MPHILLTANSAWSLVNFRRSLIQTLIADGYQLTVLVPSDDHLDELKAMGCRVIPLRMDNKGTSLVREIALLLRFWRVFRAEKPDVVLSYTIKNNIYSALVARLVGVAVLPNITGLGTMFIINTGLTKLIIGLYRIAFRKVPAVFFQNRNDQQLFLDKRLIENEQAVLLPGSGIDLVKFAPAPARRDSDDPVFLLIARMLWDKGVGEFAEAARHMKSAYPNARFQLLGFLDVENRSAISRSTIDGWVEDGVVEFLGVTNDVRPAISAADCIVLPTFYPEGTPRTLLEAASMARPIITTDTPGCRDVVDDGQTGFLCQPRDTEDLIAKIEQMIALPEDARNAMGVAGRKKMVDEFDEAIVIRAYQHQITKLISKTENP